jgi:hypothetical protein
MKQCGNIKADLSAFVDAELPAARRAEVAAHLAACAACREHATELERLARGVSALPQASLPAGILVEVRRRLQEPAAARRIQWWSPAWGTAAAALIVAGMVAFWVSSRRSPMGPETSVSKTGPGPSAVAKLERSRQVTIAPVDPEEAVVVAEKGADKKNDAKDWKVADKLAGGDAPAVEVLRATALPVTPPAASVRKPMPSAGDALTIVSTDAQQVQKEVQLIADGLQGRVEPLPAGLRVRLPVGNVAMFKARLAQREDSRKEAAARLRFDADEKQPVVASAPAPAAPLGGSATSGVAGWEARRAELAEGAATANAVRAKSGGRSGSGGAPTALGSTVDLTLSADALASTSATARGRVTGSNGSDMSATQEMAVVEIQILSPAPAKPAGQR